MIWRVWISEMIVLVSREGLFFSGVIGWQRVSMSVCVERCVTESLRNILMSAPFAAGRQEANDAMEALGRVSVATFPSLLDNCHQSFL